MSALGSLTYTFSRREKVMIGVFSLLLLGLLWYQFVYVVTKNQLAELEGRIQTTQANIEQDNVKLAEKRRMQHVIEQHKAAGIQAKPIPVYDNLKPLMRELDDITAKTDQYALTFDSLDTQSTSYVLRGVGVGYKTKTYDEAKNVIVHIADGQYPCIISSFTINEQLTLYGRNSEIIDTNLHVIFIERPAA